MVGDTGLEPVTLRVKGGQAGSPMDVAQVLGGFSMVDRAAPGFDW